jgi:copper chaperone CopZ
MRSVAALLLAFLIAVPALAAAEGATARATIPVAGMHCGGCAEHIDAALTAVPGVKSAETDIEKAQTVVVYDPAQVKPAALVKAIEEAGYKPGAAKAD